MAEAALKTEMMDAPDHTVLTPNRFFMPDMNEKGVWLVQKLKARWPDRQDRFFTSWLGGMMAGNEFYFVHTKNAVALAERVNEGLNTLPSVRVWFVLVKDNKNKDQIEDGADLYTAIAKWATDIGAARVIDLEKFTDIPRPMIQARLGGRLLIEETIYAITRKK